MKLLERITVEPGKCGGNPLGLHKFVSVLVNVFD